MDLSLALILGVPLVAGCVAWSREARKTACGLWVLVPLLFFAVWAPSNIGAKASAQENACRANLRQIDGAVNRWALEHEKKAANSYSFTEPVLLSYLKGSALPTCPTGGHYSPGATVTNAPKCSLAAQGHTL